MNKIDMAPILIHLTAYYDGQILNKLIYKYMNKYIQIEISAPKENNYM